MDITRHNFTEELPRIKQTIDQSTFLSIDAEFTGLNTSYNYNEFDSLPQHYSKLYESCKDFLIIQLGVSAFRYIPESQSFEVKTYNFYTYPRKTHRLQDDQVHFTQTSTMEFLIRNGFDFNKLFKDGITYMNKNARDKFEAALESAKLNDKQEPVEIPPETKPLIDRILSEIESFVDGNEDERVLPACERFERFLVYKSLPDRLRPKVRLDTRTLENNDRILVATRPKTEDSLSEENKKIIEDAVGFSDVMEYISGSGKLIVGHNMLLDLFHIINRFFTNVPDNYEDFKELAHFIFPRIIDTKHLGSSAAFEEHIPNTILGKMVEILSHSPFSTPKVESEDDSTSYSLSCTKEHEAGYDAYITGLSFISMWEYLGRNKDVDAFENYDVLQQYTNRLYLMRVQGIPFVRLDGPDVHPPRGHVVHLTFPKEWQMKEIRQLFQSYGFIRVSFIDDHSAYVGLKKTIPIPGLIKSLSKENVVYSVMTYSQHQQTLQKTVIPKQNKEIDDDGFILVRGKSNKRKSTNQADAGVSIKQMKVPNPQEGLKAKKTFTEDTSWE